MHTIQHNRTDRHHPAPAGPCPRETTRTTAAAPLGKSELTRPLQVTAPEKDGRLRLREIRQTMQRLTDSDRYRGCGVHPNASAAEISLTWAGKGSARFTGLQTCKSVHVCPVCAAAVVAERARALERAVERHLAAGGAVALLTLTVAHGRGDRLEAVNDTVAKAWTGLTSDKAWKGKDGVRARYGLRRSPVWGHEITHGYTHGWHPHRHVLLFLDASLPAAALEALQAEVYTIWRRKVTGLGAKAPHPVHGVDVRQVAASSSPEDASAVAAYVAKGHTSGLAMEITGGANKEGRKGNRTPFQLLANIHAAYVAGGEPDPRDVATWKEYEEFVTRRRVRLFQFPTSLKEEYDVEELTEEEAVAAAEEAEDTVEPVALVAVPREEWRVKLSRNLEAQHRITSHVARARDPLEARLLAAQALDLEGVRWREVMLPTGRTGITDDELPTHTEAFARDLRAHVKGRAA